MKYLRYILILMLTLSAISCKEHHTNDVATDSINYIKPEFQYLQGNFSCSIMDMQVHGQLRMQSDSIIWVSLNKIIELGRLEMTPDSIYLYSKLNNAYFTGTYQQVADYFAYNTNFIAMQNLFVEAIQSDAKSVQIPIRSNIINIDLQLALQRITYPSHLSFPFHIPPSAKPISQPIIQ